MTALLDELMEHPLTEDDLDSVGRALDGTGIRYELDNGRLVLMSPIKGWHADELGQGARYGRIGAAVLTELEAKYGTR